MGINVRLGRLLVVVISIFTCLALAAVAFAQSADLGSAVVDDDGNCEEIVTIPSGTDPGVYNIEITGEVIVEDGGDYPPDSALVETNVNVATAGDDITVMCEGFAPGTTVTIRLVLVAFTEQGTFSLAQVVTEDRTVRTRIVIMADDDDADDDDDDDDPIIIGRGDRTIIVNNSSSASSSAAAAAGGGGGGDTTTTNTNTVVVQQTQQQQTQQQAGNQSTVGKAAEVLARTGVDALPLAAAALAAILLGTVLLGAARRKRTAG